MKKIFSVFLACVLLQVAAAQEGAESERSPRTGLTLGLGVILSDVADKAVLGVRSEVVFDKTLGGLHLYGDVYDKVRYDDPMDMRITHFEQEIGYRFGITQAAGIGVFANNVNNIYDAPQGEQGTAAMDGSAAPGLAFDGAFSFWKISYMTRSLYAELRLYQPLISRR
jgi:hypothetical protein